MSLACVSGIRSSAFSFCGLATRATFVPAFDLRADFDRRRLQPMPVIRRGCPPDPQLFELLPAQVIGGPQPLDLGLLHRQLRLQRRSATSSRFRSIVYGSQIVGPDRLILALRAATSPP